MTRTTCIGLLSLSILASGCNDTTKVEPSNVDTYDTEVVEVKDYSPPKNDDLLFEDDHLVDKKTTFDPELVDRRPLQGWSVNASEAVIQLDTPLINPDWQADQLVLHPSYTAATRKASGTVLPSVNLIDGKAKQFDDGLYAAIDQAYFMGHGPTMKSHLETLKRIRATVSKGSPTDDYLAAGLSLADPKLEPSPKAKALADAFLAEEIRSRPIGFYTWTPTLTDAFRVLRFFSEPIAQPPIGVEIAFGLRANPELRADYTRAYTFYAKLTNPLTSRTPSDLVDTPQLARVNRVTLFPQSTSRETKLFEKLYRNGLPPGTNLIRDLMIAIRSGSINLKPDAQSGWYEYQAYALETLLLPENGRESDKLLLTKAYKKRMMEAFQALITKRRETHSRELVGAKVEEAPMPIEQMISVEPRLRVEPNPTYFLRTARSYAFLANFLEATLGEATLKSLKGLREGGERDLDLHSELAWMKSLFYGLYLIGSEDIGLKPEFLEEEAVDREAAEKVATGWLAAIGTDADLGADTRVAVPIFHDPRTGAVRLWMTIGVRLTGLETKYVKAPQLRPADGNGEWVTVEPSKLKTKSMLICVDEFAEVELRGGRVLDRAQLRAICDQYKIKAKIVEALRK